MLNSYGAEPYLAWVDIETTGLDPEQDRILELAIVVTDHDLGVVASYQSVIGTGFLPRIAREAVNEMRQTAHRNVDAMHTESGLWHDVASSTQLHSAVEQRAMAFMDRHFRDVRPPGVDAEAWKPPMCGSSVHFDRSFLSNDMPGLTSKFSHRNLDVSSFNEAVYRWYEPRGPKVSAHRAMDDIMASIQRLREIRSRFMIG